MQEYWMNPVRLAMKRRSTIPLVLIGFGLACLRCSPTSASTHTPVAPNESGENAAPGAEHWEPVVWIDGHVEAGSVVFELGVCGDEREGVFLDLISVGAGESVACQVARPSDPIRMRSWVYGSEVDAFHAKEPCVPLSLGIDYRICAYGTGGGCRSFHLQPDGVTFTGDKCQR